MSMTVRSPRYTGLSKYFEYSPTMLMLIRWLSNKKPSLMSTQMRHYNRCHMNLANTIQRQFGKSKAPILGRSQIKLSRPKSIGLPNPTLQEKSLLASPIQTQSTTAVGILLNIRWESLSKNWQSSSAISQSPSQGTRMPISHCTSQSRRFLKIRSKWPRIRGLRTQARTVELLNFHRVQ